MIPLWGQVCGDDSAVSADAASARAPPRGQRKRLAVNPIPIHPQPAAEREGDSLQHFQGFCLKNGSSQGHNLAVTALLCRVSCRRGCCKCSRAPERSAGRPCGTFLSLSLDLSLDLSLSLALASSLALSLSMSLSLSLSFSLDLDVSRSRSPPLSRLIFLSSKKDVRYTPFLLTLNPLPSEKGTISNIIIFSA